MIYLNYRIEEGLGVIARETSHHIDSMTIREDGGYQSNALFRGKGVTNQLFPVGRVTTRENTIRL